MHMVIIATETDDNGRKSYTAYVMFRLSLFHRHN